MKIGPGFEKHRQAAGVPSTRCTNSSGKDGPWWRRFDVLLMGCAALLWLILRSGSKPTRLSYPCQQSAFGFAAGRRVTFFETFFAERAMRPDNTRSPHGPAPLGSGLIQ